MQKEKILFVMESLRIGGAEKSLLTLLSKLDYGQYEVELFLFRHDGELMKFLPKQVRLLPEDAKYHIFDANRKAAPWRYLSQGDLLRAWHSLCYLIGCVWQRVTHRTLYIGWNHVRYHFSATNLTADVAVAYLERKCVYFTANFVKAERKIAFIHNDYSVYPYDEALDTHFFADYQKIATVSEHCRQVLVSKFPQYSDKFTVVPNMISAQTIQMMAKERQPNLESTGGHSLTIVTVGRLVEQKGYDRAVRICEQLVKKQINVLWIAVGDGPEHDKLQEEINDLNLQEHFILAGAYDNPYPWMQAADIYVQPSRFEGFGITVAEAKVLNKRIVCSNIPEFHEQLHNYPNALFADGEESFVNAILKAAKKTALPYSVTEEQPTEFYQCIERS